MRLLIMASAFALLTGLSLTVSAQQQPTEQRQDELRTLLYQDCGSCHGMRLTGGLGPALAPQRMRALGKEALVAMILEGVPGTAMPAWSPLLTDEDARWLARHLLDRQPSRD